jgi:hypothetical protein
LIAITLVCRRDLVGHVIDERIGTVPTLLDARHGQRCQRRDVIGLAGHPQVRADEIDMKLSPGVVPM